MDGRGRVAGAGDENTDGVGRLVEHDTLEISDTRRLNIALLGLTLPNHVEFGGLVGKGPRAPEINPIVAGASAGSAVDGDLLKGGNNRVLVFRADLNVPVFGKWVCSLGGIRRERYIG